MTQLTHDQSNEIDSLVVDIIAKLAMLGIPLTYTSNKFLPGTEITEDITRVARLLDVNLDKLSSIMDDIARSPATK